MRDRSTGEGAARVGFADTGHRRECMMLAAADLAQFLIDVDAH